MQQNTDEWLLWRHKHIGASDAVIVMGVSPYKKRAELLFEKRQPKPASFEMNFIQRLGHFVEELERPRFELLMDQEFPGTLAESEDYKFLSASYDGMNEDATIAWECKLCGRETFEQVMSGKIPDKWYPQIAQQFLVSKSLKKIILNAVLYQKDKMKSLNNLDQSQFKRAAITIKFDDNIALYIRSTLLPELKKFWDEVTDKSEFKITEKLENLMEKQVSLKEKASKVKKEIEEVESEIIKHINNSQTEYVDDKWSFSYKPTNKVTYSYKDACVENNLDLNSFKKESISWSLKIKPKV